MIINGSASRGGNRASSQIALSSLVGPILWGHSGPLCHALSLLSLWTSILHCHSPGVTAVAHRLRYSYSWLRLILVVVSTVATPGEWQCEIRTGGVRRLAVANGPNIFRMLLVINCKLYFLCHTLHDCFLWNIVLPVTDKNYNILLIFLCGDHACICGVALTGAIHRL